MATIALVLSIVLPFFLIWHCAFALISKKSYHKIPRSSDFTPKCNIFIPCKGISDEFENNIEQFFKISYPDYNLYFAVESKTDSAVEVIRKKIEFHKKGNLIVSEQTKYCGQKNLNLVRAIDNSDGTAEIYIFADSDIAPNADWLDAMISPFQNAKGGLSAKITATTGFRWLFPKNKSLGSIVHSFQNYVLFVLFAFAAKVFNSGLWGGSMAIRKKDYDSLNVRARWLETSVDDLSLSEILAKNKKKIHFCYDAITDTDDTINDYKKAGKWYVRQVQYLKYHAKPLWLAAILMAITAILMYLTVLCIVIFAACSTEYLLVPVFFLGGIYLFSAMFALLGKSKYMFLFILLSPVSLWNVCVSVIKTAFENKIDWSGYRYFMNWNGKVKKVEKI